MTATVRTHEHKLTPAINASSPVEHSRSLPGQKQTRAWQLATDYPHLQDIAIPSLFWNNSIPPCISFCCTTHVKDTEGMKQVRMDVRNSRLKSTEYFLTRRECLSSVVRQDYKEEETSSGTGLYKTTRDSVTSCVKSFKYMVRYLTRLTLLKPSSNCMYHLL